MSHARVKFLIAALAVLGAVSFLAYAGVKKGRVYYMTVDAFLADPQIHNQRVRLCGTVSAQSLVIKAAQRQADFILLGEKGRVPVAFHGDIPDLFKAGADVVVEGRLEKGGSFQAVDLMTKCASKYKPQAPASQPEGGS